MKRVTGSIAAAVALTVLLQGTAAECPSAMLTTTGLLIYRDSENVVAYWDGAEFVPMNMTGWSTRFGTDLPSIPVHTWAIVHGPHLDITAGSFYDNFTASSLFMAMHFVPAYELEPLEVHKNFGQVSDLESGDPEFDDVREDVDDYVAAVMSGSSV